MKKAPKLQEIREWLIEKDSLGLFRNGNFEIEDIDPKPWSGHFNYLLKLASGDKFILRFKGPEWGEKDGIINEYKTLNNLGFVGAGPRVHGLLNDFFGETAMIMDYIEGDMLNKLPEERQRLHFRNVADIIAMINKIPLNDKKDAIPFRREIISYAQVKEKWKERLAVIGKNKALKKWAEKIELLLPRAEKMLDEFEPLLNKVIYDYGPVFIFESAHIGHCIICKSDNKPMFLNWEAVSYGDPSYTLAVFLASISNRADFEVIKDIMVRSYLELKQILGFLRLVNQRLEEREVSNLIWVLWNYANKGETKSVEEATSAPRRLERVREILASY